MARIRVIALVVAMADRREPDRQPVDLRYFDLRQDATEQLSDMGYAFMRVKNVAANRHVPVHEVRRLMEGVHDKPRRTGDRPTACGTLLASIERWTNAGL